MGWQFYGLSATVAHLGVNTLMQVTVIQTLSDVKRLLEKRADGELRDLLAKTELIVEVPKKERRRKASCQRTLQGYEQNQAQSLPLGAEGARGREPA